MLEILVVIGHVSLFQPHYNCVFVGHRFKVPVESGLDDETALEILALYVNGKSRTLPEQARSIVKECKGIHSQFSLKFQNASYLSRQCHEKYLPPLTLILIQDMI